MTDVVHVWDRGRGVAGEREREREGLVPIKNDNTVTECHNIYLASQRTSEIVPH